MIPDTTVKMKRITGFVQKCLDFKDTFSLRGDRDEIGEQKTCCKHLFHMIFPPGVNF